MSRNQGASQLQIEGTLKYGEFIPRPNRFLAICKINERRRKCYIPIPGPMPDLLFPGVEVLLRHSPTIYRKTDYDLICVRHCGQLLSLDTRVPNKILAEAFASGALSPFAQYEEVHTEVIYQGSRFDFMLKDSGLPTCFIEAKSSTHAEQSIAYFPRAVTSRGQRHLQKLMHAFDHGYRSAIIFIVQRNDAKIFRPNDRIDPDFGSTLRKAAQHGVETYAWTTRFDEETNQILFDHSLQIDLSTPKLI